MDCYLVDTRWLKEAFGGDRILDIKPTNGLSIWGKVGNFELSKIKDKNQLVGAGSGLWVWSSES